MSNLYFVGAVLLAAGIVSAVTVVITLATIKHIESGKKREATIAELKAKVEQLTITGGGYSDKTRMAIVNDLKNIRVLVYNTAKDSLETARTLDRDLAKRIVAEVMPEMIPTEFTNAIVPTSKSKKGK
jgi:hypothetical protein